MLTGTSSHSPTGSIRGRFILACLLLAACVSAAPADDLKAPDFTLPDLEGKDTTQSSFLEKGPVIVNFWATWCKPCVRELPHLQEVYDKFKEQGVTLLAVSVDSPRSVSKVKSFVNGHNYTFTVLLDSNKDVSRLFNAHLFPYTFVISKQGDIVYKNYGYRPGDEKNIESQLISLLAEGSPLYQIEKGGEGE